MAVKQTIEERFWAKVQRDGATPGHTPGLSPCWVWLGGRTRLGYGRFAYKGQKIGAHRAAWLMLVGPIPADKPCVLHHCDNPPCVNPDHLWVGTNDDNIRDMVAKGRQRAPRGDDNGQRLHPDRVARGERAGPAKLTADGVREVRRRRANGELQRVIARDLGVTQTVISLIDRGLTWNHVE